jgi:anti-sigma regulatory factor (Ser/Thr protein kinase)
MKKYMRLHISNSAFLGNINAFIKAADFSDPSSIYITANEKWMSVHPVVLCMIAALGVKVRTESKSSRPILCERFTATSKHYFERMRLFQFLKLNSEMNIVEHDSSGRFIPITQIQNPQTLARFIEDMIPLLHLNEQQAQSIKYIVSEIVRNVLEHSGSKYGAFVAAQYHKKTNTVRIGIVDTGVGIRETISRFHNAPDDRTAIQLALTPGITGTTSKEGGTDYNAGAGLFFTKSISKTNKDFFVIYSGNALYKLLRKQSDSKLNGDPFMDRHTLDSQLPIWSGTVVGIDMTLDDNENFSALLTNIRDAYSATVRERRRKQYKKPKFI